MGVIEPSFLRLFVCLIVFFKSERCLSHESFKNRNLKGNLIGSDDRFDSSEASKYMLFNHVACTEDLKKFCGSPTPLTNLNVLDCFHNSKRILKSSGGDWSPDCSHLLWMYRKNVTQTNQFVRAAERLCKDDLSNTKVCNENVNENGFLLSCMIENKHNFTSPSCMQFLVRMETIVLSDYRLIYKFSELCDQDIRRLKCGRASTNDDNSLSQGQTIECLSESINSLSESCQKEILKISEWQADDVRLDRALYFACKEDQEHYCSKANFGDGKIYDCLMAHKLERDMSKQCQDQLVRRQKLISMDYKVSRSIATSCKEAIKIYKCKKDTSSSRGIRLAQILLCLEDVLKKGERIAADCQRQMLSYRRALMEDYRLSPDLINSCHEEIRSNCGGQNIGGKTIHCLMDLIKNSHDKSKQITVSLYCKTELKKFLKEVDINEDWSVDPVLKEACQSVVNSACNNIKSGSGRVISCLMDKLESDHMTVSCEEALLRIQYFVARDYTLDPKLYRNCEYDVKRHCNSEISFNDGNGDSDLSPVVFACLYKHVYQPDSTVELRPKCVDEVKRVMHQNSVSVELHPEIIDPCLNDLSKYCSRHLNKGEEIDCLQENFEILKTGCQQAIRQFTEIEAENTELNVVLFRACSSILNQLCQEVVQSGQDHGRILSCLIQHKNDFLVREQHKCRAAIDHFQLISLKDFHFDYKFQTACHHEVLAHCRGVTTKYDVVACLSSIVLNNTLNDLRHQISKECRRELRQQLLQRSENINLDPYLAKACQQDISKLCSRIPPGNSQVLECLRSRPDQLTDRCGNVLFKREIELMTDQRADYNLMSACSHMITQYCSNQEITDYVHCLQGHIQEENFDRACRKVIVQRLIEQSQDFRLSPVLQKSCHKDINQFCGPILASRSKDKAFQGKVIECLKTSFRKKMGLSSSCEQEIHTIMKNSALDSRQDPVLMKSCNNEIKQYCVEGDNSEYNGQVLECLKHQLMANKITNAKCIQEVSNRVETSFVDIQTDPILYHACSLDIKRYCNGVPAGEGRHLFCLIEVLHHPSRELFSHCQEKLQERINMYENVGKTAKLQDFKDLYNQVSRSPSRNYFVMICFTIIGFIFFGGLVCGRVTKKIRREMKLK